MRFNSQVNEIADIYLAMDRKHPAGRVEKLRGMAGLPDRLSEREVDPAMIPLMAAEAGEQWTAGFNPRVATPGEIEAIYRAAL